MSEESTALVLYDKLRALEIKKRTELESALEKSQVAEPISIGTLLIMAAVSAGVSAASYVVSRAFAPKPQRQQLGKLSGTLQLQNSEQGIMIPEVYGGGPTANIVAGSSPTYQNLTNTTAGGGGAITKTSGANNTYNAGASHNVAVNATEAFLKVTRGTGHASAGFFDTASPTGSGTQATGCVFGVAWGPEDGHPMYGIVNGTGTLIGSSSAGDVFRIEIRDGRFRLFKNSAELLFGPHVSPTYPLYFGVIMYSTGGGVSEAKVQIGSIGDPPNYAQGGIKLPAIIVWSSGIRKNVSVTQQPTGGKGPGGGTQEVETITYDIDLGLEFCRGPVTLIREYGNADVLIDQNDASPLPTGIFDPGVGPDAPYDPAAPPDPKIYYGLATERNDAALAVDGDGVGSGTIQGGGSSFRVYPGNTDQQPDPTIEADIDGKYGTGSTTAYRNHSLIVHENFSLSRWGGVVPNITAAWEHQTLKTLDDIFASFCERVNVKAATSDYDFSGLSAIASRGMVIAGRLFAPAEVMGSLDIQTAYNYCLTEAEGQIIGYAEGTEPSITIADTEVGWLDGETETPDIIPEIESILASEISLPREVTVKSISLDKEWEPDTQSARRQITDGVSSEVLEIQIAQLDDERRATAQRRLYQQYVAGSAHRFTLPWTYLYLYPGYQIIINRAEGFTHTLRLTSISGGVGILNCEGIALETAVFTQPVSVGIGPGGGPPLPIPAMTVVTLLDTPLLRDGDQNENNGVGFYMAGVPRTGVNQNWLGFLLYIKRNNTWSVIARSTLPATIGVVVSVTGLNTDDPSVFDRTGVIVVDLYGTTASLSSVAEQDVLTDSTINLGLFGNMVGQFVTATQVADFPNRWSLSTLLNGRRGTEDQMNFAAGARFVLINAAVVFVPAMITDRNSLFEYRAVTSGQSLADAATVEFVWTAEGLRPLSPVNIRGTRNSLGDLFIEWTRRSRFAGGMTPGSDVPVGEELEQYDVDILTTGNVLKRTMTVTPGGAQAGIVIPFAPRYASFVSGNNIVGTSSLTTALAYTQQVIANSGGWIEASLVLTGSFQFVTIELRPANELNPDLPATVGYTFLFNNNPAPFFEVQRSGFGLPALMFSATNVGVTRARIRIAVVGSELRFYWDYLGPGSLPLFVAPNPMPLPLRPAIFVSGASKATDIYVGNNLEGPSVIYGATQQTEDGFTPNVSTIRTRIFQISSIVGRGHVAEKDL